MLPDLLTSRYYMQLQVLLEHYDKERLLIVEAEELRDNQQFVVAQVSDFLGLPYDHHRSILNKRFHVSKDKRRRSALERRIIDNIDNRWVRAGTSVMFKPFRTAISRPDMSDEDRRTLTEQLGPDTACLRHFCGMAFARWSV